MRRALGARRILRVAHRHDMLQVLFDLSVESAKSETLGRPGSGGALASKGELNGSLAPLKCVAQPSSLYVHTMAPRGELRRC